jgi:SIR2-like domain
VKKKLLVILGAGSSISCNMPSTAMLDGLMRKWSRAWAISHSCHDYFDALWQAIETYHHAGKASLRPPMNFEKVLGEMIALSHWLTPPPWGNTLRQTACDGAAFPFPEDYGPAVDVRHQLTHLLIELAKHMRRLSQTLDPSTESVRKYAALLDGLRGTFDVGIYNLNYDSVALAAWPDAYTGFGTKRAFEARSVHDRRDWSFIYHLHGSVHHSLIRRFGDRIEWWRDLGGTFNDGQPGYSTDVRSDGKPFPKTTLIAGGFKLDQLLVEPFQSMQATLVRHVYEADAILIGGYGFADVHVNRALRNRLAGAAEDRPPVMILDRADDETAPMTFRGDRWARELCQTLSTDGYFFFEPGHASPPVPSELAVKGSFEVAAAHRVALWYAGFVDAASRLDGIIPWLAGADDGALALPV